MSKSEMRRWEVTHPDFVAAVRREVINDLRDMACDKCQNGYGVTDESGEHRRRCMPAIKASYMLVSKYFATEE